jgi:ubiquinone/menaquinone biosynthesis C-methylase UbiE
MTKTIHPWTVDHPVSSPFAFPEGFVGYLAGQFMLHSYDDREVLDLLQVKPEHHVLEVGFGAGGFLRRLSAHSVSAVAGVDPSPRMVTDASKRNRRFIETGNMDLRLATADETGYPDAMFDRVVSIHNVALWPALTPGLDELRRVLRPDGMLLLAWHGGRSNPLSTGKLRLPADKLKRIEGELAARFSRVEQLSATRDDVFRAWV